MSLDAILQPSIAYAENGFPVSEVIADHWRVGVPKIKPHPDSVKTFLPRGKPPLPGDVFRNPGLARSYREIARGGRHAFYKGRIASEIVAYSETHGGLFSLKDFADHTSTWVQPVSTTYRGYEVWELPPPGQGIAVLQMLNILEGYDLKKLGPASPDYWHLFVEAKKLAYADRARFYADPVFAKVPVQELVSKPYAEDRRKLISLEQTLPN